MNPSFCIAIRPTLALLVFSLPALVLATEPEVGGEKSNDHESAVTPEIIESPITQDDREHWSLQPIERPSLPAVRGTTASPKSSRLNNPIDYFVSAELASSELTIAHEADRRTLLRRIKFDLHGLPPTPSEIEQFETDASPDATERLVDRLLDSKLYGERWAQHWLDLARFAETDGFEHDKVRRDAWQYRDWVIRAFNEDLPYDQFIRQQLAGDLMSENVATMFLMCGPDMPDINEQDLRRHDKLNELTGTVGAAVLGLQFQCAQCHDHKYDPISQADFYRLRAIFESAIPRLKRDQHVLTLSEQREPVAARIYRRGELKNAGSVVLPGLPRLATQPEQNHILPEEQTRLRFCDWLFAQQNPLTARVIANRIWQHHFGQSLTENPSDFGVVAGGPSHPELLDWLASELMEHHWSLKHLHRTILCSATYRQAGKAGCEDLSNRLKLDPDGDRYSYYPGFRLDGEVIRDAMLAVSEQLDTSMYGPSVSPPLPEELESTLLKNQWKVSPTASEHCRRSIYVFARRNLMFPIFEAFDRPDAGSSCAVRSKSTTAVQSLYLLNSPFTLQCAKKTAALVLQSDTTADSSVAEGAAELFEVILGRAASSDEISWLEHYMSNKALQDGRSSQDSLTTLALALFNSNEFIYVD